MQTTWDPARYGMFADERLRPGRDLLDRVPLRAPGVVYDLGCGVGNVTSLMVERWPGAETVGVDSSVAMLGKAREAHDDIAWVEADVASWCAPKPADLLFANASLHWLDDHAALFPRLVGQLGPGGVLAVQMPRNFDAPSHACMREVARAGPWRDKLARARVPSPVADPETYYDILAPHAARLDIWETEYLHVLEGDNPVVEWTRGTGMRPFLAPLDEDERAAFLADYAVRVAHAYPRRSDGHTLFPFRRIFMVATR